MTATLVARLVERGLVPSWQFTLQEAFPDVDMGNSDHGGITITQLLAHTSDLPANLNWGNYLSERDMVEARQQALIEALDKPLPSSPGESYLYSNLGYVLAGAVAEAVSGESWETLMQVEVFDPLGMASAGFGPAGVPFRLDQPWPHSPRGFPLFSDGPSSDNPPVIGPAGAVHSRLRDWAKLARVHLDESASVVAPGYLTPDTNTHLHTAVPNSEFAPGIDYSYGWVIEELDGLRNAFHDGSNVVNYARVWLALDYGVAVLAVTIKEEQDQRYLIPPMPCSMLGLPQATNSSISTRTR